MKEKLREYALIAEIISAIAVVAGLVFVGLQIQQGTEQSALNTRALETAAYQDLIEQILSINTVYDTDPYLDDLITRGVNRELTDEKQLGIYRGYAITVLRHADMACFQYQQGMLSKERLASAMAIFMTQVYIGQPEVYTSTIIPIINISPGLDECIALIEPMFSNLVSLRKTL